MATILKNKTVIAGMLTLLAPLHIGSGKMSAETDATVMKDAAGRPFIPGSSIKGVFRTTVERLHHLVVTPEKPVCYLINKGCNDQPSSVKEELEKRMNQVYEKYEEDGVLDEKEVTRFLEQHICPVCLLFGSTLSASKLVFHDATLLSEEWETETTIRHSVAIDRETGAASDGAKYDYEVAQPGLKFAFKIEGENLTETDKQLLVIALNELVKGRMHIGGKISRGLGLVKLENDRIYSFDFTNEEDKKKYLQFIINGEEAIATDNGVGVNDWLQEFVL